MQQNPQPGSIFAANVNALLPFTKGSIVAAQYLTGPGVATIEIGTSLNGATLHVGTSLSNQYWTQLKDNTITNTGTGAQGAITGAGSYTVPCPAGWTFVYCTAYGSAEITGITISVGSGSGTPGIGGGGDAVSATIVSPLGAHSAVEIEGVASGTPVPVSGTVTANQGTAGSSAWPVVTHPETSAPTEATPTVANNTSTTLLAAGTYNNIVIQNNLSVPIMVSFSGNTLTGITPSATNIGMVLAGGQIWQEAPNGVTTDAITVYQSSGSSTNAIYVRTN